MGFFARLTKAKPAASDSADLRRELAELNRDGRMHSRIRLQDSTLATLTLPNGGVGSVLDLSYGGIGAVFPADCLKERPTAAIAGSLRILGLATQIRMTLIRVAGSSEGRSIAGLCMHHDTPASLMFLRDFVEPSRHGATLSLVPREHRPPRYQDEHWHCYRGDGPTDLILRTAATSPAPEEALLTFRMNESYCELAFRGGQLKTGRALGGTSGATDAGSTRMGMTLELDLKILRAAAFTLAAAPHPCREVAQQVLELSRSTCATLVLASPAV